MHIKILQAQISHKPSVRSTLEKIRNEKNFFFSPSSTKQVVEFMHKKPKVVNAIIIIIIIKNVVKNITKSLHGCFDKFQYVVSVVSLAKCFGNAKLLRLQDIFYVVFNSHFIFDFMVNWREQKVTEQYYECLPILYLIFFLIFITANWNNLIIDWKVENSFIRGNIIC